MKFSRCFILDNFTHRDWNFSLENIWESSKSIRKSLESLQEEQLRNFYIRIIIKDESAKRKNNKKKNHKKENYKRKNDKKEKWQKEK